METGEITTTEEFVLVIKMMFASESTIHEKETADKLLGNLYKSSHAWPICKEILGEAGRYESSHIFTTAKILRVKVMYYFNELDESLWAPLFQFILKCIKETQVKSARVLLSESMMIIYMRLFDKEPDLLMILAQAFHEENEASRNCILQILEVLPQLMADENVVIEDEKREAFINYVATQLQPQVLQTLNIACQHPSNSGARKYQLLRCFDAWIIERSTEEVKQALHNLSLIQLCFAELGTEKSNSDEASDALCSLMVVCNDPIRYQNLYQTLIRGLFAAKPKINELIRTKDSDELEHYIKIFGKLAVNVCAQSIAEPNNETIQYILYDVLLKIYQDDKIDLIGKLSSHLVSFLKKLKPSNVPENRLTDEAKGVFVQTHYPFLEGIVEATCNKATLTVKHLEFFETHTMHEDDEEEEFNEKNNDRHDASNIISKISKLIGPIRVFSIIAKKMAVSISMLQQSQQTEEAMSQALAKFEGELYCILGAMKNPVDSKNEEDIKMLQQMLQLVLSINFTKQKVLHTSLRIISKCSMYFGTRSDLLQLAIKLLANCINNPKFEEEAAEALSNLCKNNKSFVIDNLPDFFNCRIMSNSSLQQGLQQC